MATDSIVACQCGGFQRARLNEEVLRRAREVAKTVLVKTLHASTPQGAMALEALVQAIKAVDDYEGARNMLNPSPEGCPQPF